MTAAFLLTSLVVAISPGTGVVHTLATAVAAGRRAGLAPPPVPRSASRPARDRRGDRPGRPAARRHAGVRGGDLAGCGVPALMAWSALRDRGTLTVGGDRPPRPTAAVFRDGVLLNLLNPKVTVFFVALLPQFVPPDARRHRACSPAAWCSWLSRCWCSPGTRSWPAHCAAACCPGPG
ncbi:LysE family transporter [Micromonospora sp. BRA006-A]|nr:LysE family transporter [Micromonospora sp. BRA006-A]